jgi:RimJ/RimL family protein N-acetyltransferase
LDEQEPGVMTNEHTKAVLLRPWSEDDLGLLIRLMGDPEMMAHLGGPETPEQISARHARYLAMQGQDRGEMLVLVLAGLAVGSIGYWLGGGHGEPVWETGWSVVPEAQGRGVAKAGVRSLLERLRATPGISELHAYPSINNAPSNGLCRALGFALLGDVQFEYPKGQTMPCNDWIIDLGF